MMDSISWGEFLKGLGILLVLYYGYVFIRFYRPGYPVFLKGLNRSASPDVNKKVDPSVRSVEPVKELLGLVDREIMLDSESEEEVLKKLRSKLMRAEIPESKTVRTVLANHILSAAKAKGLVISEAEILDLLAVSPN